MRDLYRKNSSWRLLLLLIVASFVVASCSVIPEEEDTQSAYDGPPVVNIVAPLPNDTYYEGVGVNIVARVENAGPDISRVIVTLDGQIIGEAALPNSSGAPSFVVTNGWVAAGVGSHTIGVVASRNDGTPSNPVNVPINVVAAPNSNQTTQDTVAPTEEQVVQQPPTTEPETVDAEAAEPQPTDEPAPTDPPPPTDEPEPTEVPPTETPSQPQVRVVTGANIRRGASTAFEPPIGSLAAGAVNDLLAVSPNGQWYKIQYYNSDGWIFANTVEVIGNTDNLPVDAGPPTPIPATNTPVPTNTPIVDVDLSIVDSSTDPFPLECGRDSTFRIVVANSGTGSSQPTKLVIEDLYDGNVQTSLEADVRGLAPGETQTLTLFMQTSTNVGEGHTSRIRIDPNNNVPEINENNNREDNDYVLASSSVC